MDQETQVVSFVLRFMREEPKAVVERAGGTWRGVIRHVQSDDERHFTRWSEALAFISEHITLDEGRMERCDGKI